MSDPDPQYPVLRLCGDLGMAPVLLWDILLHRRTMPTPPALHTCEVLSWSHCRRLAHLPTQAQRGFYERAAAREGWSVRQFEQAIRADAYARDTSQPWAVPPDEDPSAGRPLKPTFGHLHTYRLVDGDTLVAVADLGLGQVGFIVLATHRTDTYGRYLANLRYLPGEPDPGVVCRRGLYLNRQLLDEHLAVRYLR